MDASTSYSALVALHAEFTLLLDKNAQQLAAGNYTARTSIDCVMRVLNDIETALTSGQHHYPPLTGFGATRGCELH